MNDIHGFIFGKSDNKFVAKQEDMDGHILVVGGAGSGKTSCIAIPSLITWKHRVFAIDIKGELYAQTRNAKNRRNIKVFDPLNSSSYGYDPFYLLPKTSNQAQEIEAISHALIPLPPDTKDAFWIESARNMLTGAFLHFYNLKHSFIDCIKKIQSTPVGKLIDEICNNTKTDEARLYLNAFIYMENKELSGVYAELSRHIMIFATDKNIKNALSQSRKITPDDLEKNSDVYICIPQHLLRQWKNLLTLIVSQFLRHFEKRPDMSAIPILFLLDEFARLGKIEGITDGLATLRSKKITICPIIQSLAQLDMIYGRDTRRVIVDNCQYKAVLGATDADSQEYFSRLVGTYDKLKVSINKNYSTLFGMSGGSGIGKTLEEKRRIKPEDFATLNKIALFTPFGFFRVEKVPYYKSNLFFIKN